MELIEKEKAIGELMQQADAMKKSLGRYADERKGILTAIRIIRIVPKVDAEPVRHGHWIDVTDLDSPDYEFACSECYYRNFERAMDAGAWNYCPNCGAKMDEVSE